MGHGLVLAREEPGALQHHVHAQLAPGQLGRIAVGQHLDLVAINDHGVAFDADRARELAVGGVVLGQVRIGVGITQVVDGNDLDFVGAAGLVQRTQDIAADAAVPVDRDLRSHVFSPWLVG